MPKKGSNRLVLYALTYSSGTYSIGSSEIVFNQTISTQVTGHPAKGAVTIALTQQKDDPEYSALLSNYLTESADGSTPTPTIFEDGSAEDVAVATGAKRLVAFWYGGSQTYDGKDIRKLLIGCCILTGNTGDFTQGYNASTQPGVSLQFVPTPGDIALGDSKFLADYVDTAATGTYAKPATLSEGAVGLECYMELP